ncbi:MAG TPA: Fis family transcriptional regulator [Rhodospirillaceae bacterium]|nr:Fis family transcriptional regulator [Rhodospirillaceae bacterium]MAX63232.1 Fis family transcriptional regulator [Rhodospirillaceae bacterium]MBB59475.1 Fis family transcriptional regulator [Rhodospirillaceae bacterium]HAJ20542.1 Fis family transcriptional regulator [Rhodospirillaceae bacterium]HBM13809.1 Fis family transcriptional regulator [Rhodospirillaceae bacterium]|tara:strand:+ start:8604 stop:8894 length:291 start_codon:yes stop_codon:yes gene_type:complete
MSDITTGHVGSSFDDFLIADGTYEEAADQAVKRVLAFQLAEVMTEQGVSKPEMARRLETSRSQLDRILDPRNDSISLKVLKKAAHAVGRSIKIELV